MPNAERDKSRIVPGPVRFISFQNPVRADPASDLVWGLECVVYIREMKAALLTFNAGIHTVKGDRHPLGRGGGHVHAYYPAHHTHTHTEASGELHMETRLLILETLM